METNTNSPFFENFTLSDNGLSDVNETKQQPQAKLLSTENVLKRVSDDLVNC